MTPRLARPALALVLAAGLAGAARAADVERLVAAYPDHVAGLDGADLVFRDGTRMRVSDGIEGKSFEALLADPDIDDMFAYRYPAGPGFATPGRNEDPGRIRNEAFFAKMYGDCRKGGLGDRIVAVPWLPKHGGGRIRVTRVNGVADRLAAVSRDFEAMPEAALKPLLRYLKPAAGGYDCRPIAGTDRLSGHGFGIAVDIATGDADYWYWTDPTGRKVTYRNRIPWAVAEAFERHGFVWGAKWYHHDTLHFEYRPEFFVRQPDRPRALRPRAPWPGSGRVRAAGCRTGCRGCRPPAPGPARRSRCSSPPR